MATFAKNITTEEETKLNELAQSDDEVTKRHARCILMSAQGKTTVEIGMSLGFTERSARNVIHAFNETGIESVHRSELPGRPRLLKNIPTDVIEQTLTTSPRDFSIESDYWSLESLAKTLGIQFGISGLSADTLSREMRRRGVNWVQAKSEKARLRSQATAMAEQKRQHRAADRTSNLSDQPQSIPKDRIYSGRLINPDEEETYDAIAKNLREEFCVSGGVEEMNLQLAAVCYMKLAKAHIAEDWEKAERLDRMLRGHMAALKAAKKKQEKNDIRPTGDTPAERATSLLEKLAEAEAAEKAEAESEDNEQSQ